MPRLGTYFDRSPFRSRIEDQGRSSDCVKALPTYVSTAEHATFTVASAVLAAQLRGLHADQGLAILSQIKRSLDSLSPAERRVADHVLAHPRSALGDPIAHIARAAQVSQPASRR